MTTESLISYTPFPCQNGSSRRVRISPCNAARPRSDACCAVNQYGLFKFRTAQDSRPSTPTANASTRSRNTLFSLDAISRGLFSPSKIGGEGFTSISHKRSRSAMSRASSATTETSFKFSQRSNSTMGSSVPDEDSMGHRGRRTSKRGKSPGLGYTSEPERERSISRMSPDKTGSSYAVSDEEAFNVSRETLGHPHGDNSEFDLSMRLELARKNSQSQGQAPSKQPERLDPTQLADTILEGIYLLRNF